MRFMDIQRQKTWVRQCSVKIDSIEEPVENDHGFCQVLKATDGMGRTEIMNYFYSTDFHPEASVNPDEVGAHYYDIRFKDGYFQCRPAEAPQQVERDAPDWDKINLGKCRHGILCAILGNGEENPWHLIEDKEKMEAINKLAQFSMTGEIK